MKIQTDIIMRPLLHFQNIAVFATLICYDIPSSLAIVKTTVTCVYECRRRISENGSGILKCDIGNTCSIQHMVINVNIMFYAVYAHPV